MRRTSHILGARHGHHAAPLVALVKRIKQQAAKHHRISRGERLLPGFQFQRHLLHFLDFELRSFFVGGAVWLLQQQWLFKGPRLFGASSQLLERLHRQLNHASPVFVLIPVPPAGVVVHEQAAHVVVLLGVPLHPVFIGAGQGIRHAGTRGPLIFDLRHVRPQIHLLGQIDFCDLLRRLERLRAGRGLHRHIAFDRMLPPLLVHRGHGVLFALATSLLCCGGIQG